MEIDADRVYESEEWPYGLRCAACNELFIEGQPISERLDSFIDDIPCVVIVCVGCNLSGAELSE